MYLSEMHKICIGVVFQIGIQTVRYSILSYTCLNNGVAICCCFDTFFSANHATSTTHVFNDNGLGHARRFFTLAPSP